MISRMMVSFGGALFWVTLALASSHFFGADQFLFISIVAILGTLTVGTIFGSARKRRLNRALAAIDNIDARPVMFRCAPAQAPLALEVAKSNGWVGEFLSESTQDILSIRFTPGDGAFAVQEFLEALFEAKLVQEVQP